MSKIRIERIEETSPIQLPDQLGLARFLLIGCFHKISIENGIIN